MNFGVSPDFAIDSTEDIAAKAKIRSTLSLRELLVVMRTFAHIQIAYFDFEHATAVAAHILPDMANGLYANRAVEEEIDFCVLNEDELNDKASDALFSIRQKSKNKCGNKRKKLTFFQVVGNIQISARRHSHAEKRQVRNSPSSRNIRAMCRA